MTLIQLVNHVCLHYQVKVSPWDEGDLVSRDILTVHSDYYTSDHHREYKLNSGTCLGTRQFSKQKHPSIPNRTLIQFPLLF